MYMFYSKGLIYEPPKKGIVKKKELQQPIQQKLIKKKKLKNSWTVATKCKS